MSWWNSVPSVPYYVSWWLWGGRPRRRRTSRSGCSWLVERRHLTKSSCPSEKADVDVGRRPGGPPHRPWPVRQASRLLPILLATTAFAASGPVEFGLSEFQAANATRKWPVKVKTELSLDAPESFRIEPYTAGGGRVTGGDLRGLMYGLIEAAGQLRSLGRLKPTHGVPATPLRAVRLKVATGDLDQPWFSSETFWRGYFQTLARSRFNRFNLAVPRLLEPPSRLCMLSQLAAAYGIDFTLGLPEPAGDPVLLRSRLGSILAACPSIRGIEMDAGSAPLEWYRDAVVRTIETAGRRLTLDLHYAAGRPDSTAALTQAALDANLHVRVSSPSGCKEISGLPEGSCYWALHEPVAGDAESIRARVPDLTADGSSGFEMEAPREEADPPYFHGAQELFYWAWGRLSYDPKAPATPPVDAPAPPAAPAPVRPAAPKSAVAPANQGTPKAPNTRQ
jgi:hypothetical protein